MLFSHISDTHLGLQQYGLEEREQDVYDSFNQSINISIKDHVDFVIFAGDIFHTPNHPYLMSTINWNFQNMLQEVNLFITRM